MPRTFATALSSTMVKLLCMHNSKRSCLIYTNSVHRKQLRLSKAATVCTTPPRHALDVLHLEDGTSRHQQLLLPRECRIVLYVRRSTGSDTEECSLQRREQKVCHRVSLVTESTHSPIREVWTLYWELNTENRGNRLIVPHNLLTLLFSHAQAKVQHPCLHVLHPTASFLATGYNKAPG